MKSLMQYILEKQEQLSDVQSKWHPKKGLFTGDDPQEIANYLLRNSKDEAQAMQRLCFYMNRAGDKLTNKTVLNKVKQILKSEKVEEKLVIDKDYKYEKEFDINYIESIENTDDFNKIYEICKTVFKNVYINIKLEEDSWGYTNYFVWMGGLKSPYNKIKKLTNKSLTITKHPFKEIYEYDLKSYKKTYERNSFNSLKDLIKDIFAFLLNINLEEL